MSHHRHHPDARVYRDDAGAWRWRVTAANGEIVAIGEAYTRPADAERGLRDARRAMLESALNDEEEPP